MAVDSKNQAYTQAATLVRTHGIISIVFGSIGVFFGLVFTLVFAVALSVAYTDSDALGFFLLFVATILFWMLPHVYLIAAGVILTRLPEPKVAKTLTIINLVFGALWNYVLLVFAIISLVQSADYEKGFSRKK